jgi:predicted AAA+ superfamily ATPase
MVMNMLDIHHHSVFHYKYMKIHRLLDLPKSSFMLLGPRGTGKSTLIRNQINFDLELDLLQSKNFLSLSANPSLLVELTKNLKEQSWVFIDEIQKIPLLLDEVHSLIESKKLHFALSGSSARKLRRQGANLLAGRAISNQLFPLTFSEYKDVYSINRATEWGSLPQTITKPEFMKDYLTSYVETYLKEELIEEGLLRKIEPFVRFLNICGMYNGQILNVENIARESFIGRSTIVKYFEVLEETLIGFQLPSFQKKYNKKELTHPKFYLFDNGVSRACSNLIFEDVDPVWLGFAFEALIVNEVRIYNKYLKKNKELFYYRYSGGYEIDLIIENKKKTLSSSAEYTAIEIKSSVKWDKRWNDPLIDFKKKSKGKVKKLFGVYKGKEIITLDEVTVYPAEVFLTQLAENKIL